MQRRGGGEDEFRFRPAESEMWDTQVSMRSKHPDTNMELTHQVPIAHLHLDVSRDTNFGVMGFKL